MRLPRCRAQLALILFLSLVSGSCTWWHNRPLLRGGKPVVPGVTPPLLSATRDDLTAKVSSLCDAIHSFQTKVDMTPSVGSVYKGKITDFHDITAFVLYRKPNDIRIIGQLPVVNTKEFDMVSNGNQFRFLELSKNLFFTGLNDAPANSPNTFENLRPKAFLSSMLICPGDPATEKPLLEDLTDEEGAFYNLHYIGAAGSELIPGKNVWFDRTDLNVVRQIVYDNAGSIASDTHYAKWMVYEGVRFPSLIEINRPKDGYGVTMEIQEMKMNVALTNEQFELNPPEGVQMRQIGSAQPSQ